MVCLFLLMRLECPVEGWQIADYDCECHPYVVAIPTFLCWAIRHVVSILIRSLETDLARKEVLIDNTSLYQTCQRAT